MAALPLDIITDILSRLPVKPLLRFKSVSKSWYSLINSPNFTKLHLNQTLNSSTHRHLIATHSSLSSSCLDEDGDYKLNFSDLDCPTKADGFKFHGSCNGILLISDSKNDGVFLINPSTKSHCKIPPLWMTSCSLVVLFGLAYDVISDDYKVLRVVEFFSPTGEMIKEANVYSLRSNSWRRVDDVPYNLLYLECCVFVDQGLYFTAYKGKFKENCWLIVRFDIEEETYSIINIPKYENHEVVESSRLSLGDLGGCLSLLINLVDFEKIDLWVMKEYEGKEKSWVRLFSICTRENIRSYSRIRQIVKSNDGGSVLLEVHEGEHYWCDLKPQTNRLEKVQALGLPAEVEILSMGVFVESLVLLDKNWMLASEHEMQG